MKCRHECSDERIGLSDAELSMLSGFTSRAFAALAHLREAWVVADSSNRAAIERALQALMRGHSFEDNLPAVRAVLGYRLDRELRNEIWTAADIAPLSNGVPRLQETQKPQGADDDERQESA